MSDGYIIEVDNLAAGILVREGGAFAFHAAGSRFFGLQGMIFEGPASAEWAARKLMRNRGSHQPPVSGIEFTAAGTSDLSELARVHHDRNAPSTIS